MTEFPLAPASPFAFSYAFPVEIAPEQLPETARSRTEALLRTLLDAQLAAHGLHDFDVTEEVSTSVAAEVARFLDEEGILR